MQKVRLCLQNKDNIETGIFQKTMDKSCLFVSIRQNCKKKSAMSGTLNVSVGLLGHVDCGKTSLAKALSTISSTASFDKNPQSQERGITIDLGFSSFTSTLLPECLLPYNAVQFTLVDCPGHASLIKTIIGGSQIINIALLVIDISKGMETQTAECLVVAEITCDKLIIVLNKIDLLPDTERDSTVNKFSKRMKITLGKTKFKDAPIVSVSASPGDLSRCLGINELKQELLKSVELPACSEHEGPMLMAIDHCFTIKGQGTIFTGNVLEGSVKVNDTIEIPALQLVRKVKSIQTFRQNVPRAVKGDRIGMCVTQVNSKLFERGLITSEGYLKFTHACVVDLNCVKYYKHSIKSKGKYHCSSGHDTVLAKITLFSSNLSKITSGTSSLETSLSKMTVSTENTGTQAKSVVLVNDKFDLNNHYLFVDEIAQDENQCRTNFALLEFEKPILTPVSSLIIGSKLDTDVHSASCRLAFHGRIQFSFNEKQYDLSALNVYKVKTKSGQIDRVVNPREIIVKNLFGKNQLSYAEEVFCHFPVRLSTGECGEVESTFGKSGKVKVRLSGELGEDSRNATVELRYRKYLFHKKKIRQDS